MIANNDLVVIAKTWLQREEQFPIDFDEIWERAGYEHRKHAVDAIRRCFVNFGLVEGSDFIRISGESTGGRPSQTWKMTVGAAKRFLASAQTKEGYAIIDALVKAEEELTAIKTGGYGKNRVADILDDPAQANTLMLELLTRNNNLKEENIQLSAKVSDQAPKVAAFDRLEGSEGSMCVTDAAKTLSIQPKKLFDYLSSAKWLYKRIGSSVWLGYQDKIQSGLLEHVTSEVTKPDGSTVVKTRVKVTAKGIARLALELNGPLFN